jgi:uncharacterized protein RhaS with RHS repeats
MYDPNTGRWVVLDPQAKKYYKWSPYAFVGNSPLRFIDPDGKKLRPAANTSAGFMDKFKTAVNFMKERGTLGTLVQIAAHPETIYIAETDKLTRFNHKTNTLYWNPNAARLFPETGVIISAATGLNHDAGHALRWLIDPEGLLEDYKEDLNNPYTYKEEERVVTGIEQETAIKHGETELGKPTRTKYPSDSESIYTNSPISTGFTITADNDDKEEADDDGNTWWMILEKYNAWRALQK